MATLVLATLGLSVPAFAADDPVTPATVCAPADPAPATKTVYLPNVTKMLGGPTGWQTPFIVQNIGTAPTRLEVSYYSLSTGACVWRRTPPVVSPRMSWASVPGNEPELEAGGQWSVVIRSFGADIVAVVNLHQGVGARAQAMSYSGISDGATKVFLPYVAKRAAPAPGSSGWVTTVLMQNLGSAPASATLTLRPIGGGVPVTLARTIAPGASAVLDPRYEAALADGREWGAVIESDQPLAAVVNGHDDAPGTLRPRTFAYNGVLAASLIDPWGPYFDNSPGQPFGATTRIFIQNTTSTPNDPTLAFEPWTNYQNGSRDGAPVLAPGEVFEVPQSWIPDREGSFWTDRGFAVVAVIASEVDAMAYTGPTRALTKVYLPNVTRTLGGPDGWSSVVMVQFAGARNVDVKFYRFSDGTLMDTHTILGFSNGESVAVETILQPNLTEDTQYSVVVEGYGVGGDDKVIAVAVLFNGLGGDATMAYEGFVR